MSQELKIKIAVFFAALAGILLVSFLLSYPAMLLWNLCLVPAVPALAEVGWLQMWGIATLIGILVKPGTVKIKD